MTIPASARVIEWKTLQGRPAVAWRADPGGLWTRGNTPPYSTKDLLAAIDGAPIAVLASFPEPSLHDLVGDAVAFQFHSRDRQRYPYLLVASTDDSLRGPWWSCGYTMSTLAQLDKEFDIDLSTVQPLYPRLP